MAAVESNLIINATTAGAVAELKRLQAQIKALNGQLASGTAVQQAQMTQYAKNAAVMASSLGNFQASVVNTTTQVDQFTKALEANKLGVSQLRRGILSQIPVVNRFAGLQRENAQLTEVATDRVKKMNAQYMLMGKSATGAAQAIQLVPTQLNKHATAAAVAAQKQMLLNRMIDAGAVKMINWGKNTQWAGRQLMVGFTVPLVAFGAAAAIAFKEIDQSAIAFKRVYGDLSTTTAEMEKNLQAVKELGKEYTKYGLNVAKTVDLAADVAATGATGESLMAATEQTMRLATLGLMEYQEALGAVISMQTAFGVSNKDLAATIDFLNVTENETILTMQDMAAAIPRVAPVIKGLGGDIKDLAVFMTAMREGGVTAEQGANALKSGLGRLINPTKAAKETLMDFGISVEQIVERNKGDLMGLIQDFGAALATLDDFEQQQALERVFGKYQYARLGALFRNMANDASQANKSIKLATMSVEELAEISDRELSKIEEATSTKLLKAWESLKIAIAPIGEQFMKLLIPILNFATKVADWFSELSPQVKDFVTALAVGLGIIAPALLMVVGLLGNLIGNLIKGVQGFRKFGAMLKGNGAAFNYVTNAELQAKAATDALTNSTQTLNSTFALQKKETDALNIAYRNLAGSLNAVAGAASRVKLPRGGAPGAAPLRYAKGGTVPGSGNRDTVPALLTPGESVVTKGATQRYGPIISAMNSGSLPGFASGVTSVTKGGTGSVSQSGLVFAHGKDRTVDLGDDTMKQLKAARPDNSAIQGATRAYGLSNFGFMTPASLNAGQMSPAAAESLFKDPKMMDRTMMPIYKAIASDMGKSVDKVMADPKIQKDVRAYSLRMSKGIASLTTSTVGEKDFYRIADESLKDTNMSPTNRRAIEKSKGVSTVATFGPPDAQGRTKGERVALSRKLQKSMFDSEAGSSYRNWSSKLLKKLFPEAKKIGSKTGKAMGEEMVKGATQASKPLVQSTLKASGHNSPSPAFAKAGKEDGVSYAKAIKQSIMSQTPIKLKGPLVAAQPASARERYYKQQSDNRRAAYNDRRMREAGMTQTQRERTMRRLEESKARAAKNVGVSAADKQVKMAGQQLAKTINQSNGSMRNALNRFRGVITTGTTNIQAAMKTAAARLSAPSATTGRTPMQSVGTAANASVMGLMGLSMAASFAGGEIGEMANKIMPVTMGLLGLQMALPLLTSPIGLLILATGAAAAGLWYLNEETKKLQSAADDMAAALTSNAKQIESLSEFYQTRDIVSNKNRLPEEREAEASKGAEYLATEAGKAMTKGMTEAMEQVGQSTATQQFAANLADMMLRGVINQDQAVGLADALEKELGVKNLSAQIQGQLTKLVGPNGQDILTRPLDVAINIQDANSQFQSQLAENVFAYQDLMQNMWEDVGEKQEELFAGNAIEKAMTGLEVLTKSFVGAEKSRDALFATSKARLARFADANENWFGDRADQLLNAVDENYRNATKAAEAYGAAIGGTVAAGYKAAEAALVRYSDLQEKANKEEDPAKKRAMNRLLEDQAEILDELNAKANETRRAAEWQASASPDRTKIAEANLRQIEQQYAQSEMAPFVDALLGRGKNLNAKAKFMLEVDLATGIISPYAMEQMFKAIGDDQEAAAVLDLTIKAEGAPEVNTLLNSVLAVDDKDLQKRITMTYRNYSQETQEEIIVGLETIAGLPESLNKAINIETSDPKQIAEIGEKVAAFDALPEKLTKKRLTEYLETNFGSVSINMDWFLGLPAVTRRQFIAEYSSSFDSSGNLTDAGREGTMNRLGDLGGYRGSMGNLKDVTTNIMEYDANLSAQAQAEEDLKKTQDGLDDGGGGGKKERSWLEGVIDNMKANKILYIAADKEAEKYKKARKKFFGGALQRIRGMGASSEMIQMFGEGEAGLAQMQEFLSKSKKQQEKIIKMFKNQSLGQQIEDLRTQVSNKKTQNRAFAELSLAGFSPEMAKEIASNSELAADIVFAAGKKNSKQWKRMQDLLRQAYKETASPEDEAKKQAEMVTAYFDKAYAEIEKKLRDGFKQKYGVSTDMMEAEILQREQSILLAEKEIDAIEDQIRLIEQREGTGLDALKKRKDSLNENITQLERLNELDRRRIEELRREDELRNRESDALSRDLDIMSRAEQRIRDAYAERQEALEKVAKVNQHILDLQRQQLGVSDALSRGDIAAAAAAQAEMQATAAAAAAEQNASGDGGVDAAVAALTNEQGMNRGQIEERQYQLKEQSYQTSLLIRDIEDQIYNREQNQILPLKEQIFQIEQQEKQVLAEIAAKEAEILVIQQTRIEPLQNEIEAKRYALENLSNQIEMEKLQTTYLGLSKSEWDSINQLAEASANWAQQMADQTGVAAENAAELAGMWKQVGEAVDAAREARDSKLRRLRQRKARIKSKKMTKGRKAKIKDINAEIRQADKDYQKALEGAYAIVPPAFAAGGKIPGYKVGGKVAGSGGGDSRIIRATPGEFVIRKPMVDKYGVNNLMKINQGSAPAFNSPDAANRAVAVGASSTSSVYNNTYNVNVPVNNANASADEIATVVVKKIKQIDSSNVRSYRG